MQSPAQPARPGGGQPAMAPFAPTDPSAASDRYPWGPPTGGPIRDEGASNQSSGLGGGISPSPNLGGAGAYSMPGRGRPSYRRYGSPHAPTRERSDSYTYRKPAASASTASPVKPFTDYRRPPGTSAYMGLFRNNTGGGVVDNYSTLVRPRLQQQQRNSTFNTRLRGLQATSQSQAAAVQRIGQNTQRVSGTRNTSYYMNLGGYYPGLQRR